MDNVWILGTNFGLDWIGLISTFVASVWYVVDGILINHGIVLKLENT